VIKEPKLFSEWMSNKVRKTVPNAWAVLAFCGDVSYLEEKEVVYEHFQNFSESHKSIEPYLYLLKRHSADDAQSKIYAKEREYRFVFVPLDKHTNPMPPPVEKLYLKSDDLKGLVE
jgi:hypothetical protein